MTEIVSEDRDIVNDIFSLIFLLGVLGTIGIGLFIPRPVDPLFTAGALIAIIACLTVGIYIPAIPYKLPNFKRIFETLFPEGNHWFACAFAVYSVAISMIGITILTFCCMLIRYYGDASNFLIDLSGILYTIWEGLILTSLIWIVTSLILDLIRAIKIYGDITP